MANPWWFVGLIVLVELVSWLLCALVETEVFLDLTGGLSLVLAASLSYWARAGASGDGQSRQYWASMMLGVWAVRLSLFLFGRIMQYGDRRLEKYRNDPIAFIIPYSRQTAWVITSVLPVLLLNASGVHAPVGGAWDSLCVASWLGGNALSIVADLQKLLFRVRRENKGRFVSTGLWYWSRHPNYFGQLLTSWSHAAFVLPALWAAGSWQLGGPVTSWLPLVLAATAPLFETYLLVFVSAKDLERHGKRVWGDDPGFRRYTDSTPFLVPWTPKAMPGGGKRRAF
jgi:steroid 5-alpha reductase family enzyme